MRKIVILAVLILLATPMLADACWYGCEQNQNQNIYGYQGQVQGIVANWYGVGMVQGSGSNLGSTQYQTRSGECHGVSQFQIVSGHNFQGQEQMTDYGYQVQDSSQNVSGWQSQNNY